MAGYQPDVYNNIVATGMVLIFTKLVTHRFRTKPRSSSAGKVVFILHAAVVVLASASVAIAIAITADRADHPAWLGGAWVCLAISGIVLVVDVLADAWPAKRE